MLPVETEALALEVIRLLVDDGRPDEEEHGNSELEDDETLSQGGGTESRARSECPRSTAAGLNEDRTSAG